MTRADVVQRLWDFINSAPIKNSAGVNIENAEARSILEACNAAIQEIAHYAPRDFFKQTRSAILKAPVSATINVTEDSKSFSGFVLGEDGLAEQTAAASNSSTLLQQTSHPLKNGDIIKFTYSGNGDNTSPFSSTASYYFVRDVQANYFAVSETFYGTALTGNTSSDAQYKRLKEADAKGHAGASIEISGSDELMRINTFDNERTSSNIYFGNVAGSEDVIYLSDLNDIESWQHSLAVDDQIAFSGAVPEADIVVTGTNGATNSGLANHFLIPNHNLIVGDKVQITSSSPPSNLVKDTPYFVTAVGNDGSLGKWVKLSATSSTGSIVTFSATATGISYTLTQTYTLTSGTGYFIRSINTSGGLPSSTTVYSKYIKLKTAVSGGDDIYIRTSASGKSTIVRVGSEIKGSFHEEYLGTTGAKSCTIYYDAVKLNSKVTEVLGTVVLNDKTVLKPFMNDDHSARLHRDRIYDGDYTDEEYDVIPDELTDKTGDPYYYFIDSEHNEDSDGQNYYLRVRPFPENKARLRFTASILPEKWVIGDTYSSSGQRKDTGCPADYDETILLPFVYKNFVKFIGFDVLPSEGSLQSGNILLQIDEDYKQAKEILKGLEPQSERRAIYSIVY